MKAIDDIVREMRTLGRLDEKSTDKIPRSLQALGLRTYADRIEAAAKALEADRDNWRRQALDEDSIANAICDKSSQVGNAAEMRTALVEIYNEIRSYCIDYGAGENHKSLLDRIVDDPPDYTSYRDSILKIDRIVEAALAKPPRNCDVYTEAQLCKKVTE